MTKIYDFSRERGRRRRKTATRTQGDTIVHRGQVQISAREVTLAGRDVHINKRTIRRTKVQPGPKHISPEQAARLQQLIEKAVEQDVTAGEERHASYMKWWSILKKHYAVPTYREIPRHLGEDAVSWLKQRIAMGRSKLRRPDPQEWRRQHYAAIYARASELGYSKGEVYAIAKSRLGVQVTSLKSLNQGNLKKLYGILMARPSRDKT